MFKIFKNLFGTKYDRDVKLYSPVVAEINRHFDSYASISNDDLRNKSIDFRSRIAEHLTGIDQDIATIEANADKETDLNAKEQLFNQIDDLKKDRDKHLEDVLKMILPEAFAVVKETARRFTNNDTMVVTATQHDRDLAAAKAYVSIEGDQAIYQTSWLALLTIDCIDKYRPHSDGRVKAYKADITYGTNNEFGFDYLRDNMVKSAGEMVQGKHHYAMIDEVDSVLVDDARTVGVEEGEGGIALYRAHKAMPKYRPLIKFLSEEGIKVIMQKAENFYMQEQNKNMHIVDEPLLFTIDEKNRSVELTDKGIDYLSRGENDGSFYVMPDIAEEMQALDDKETREGTKLKSEREALINDYSLKSRRLHSVSQLLKAYTMFDRDQEYVVMEGQVKIVDESTGRMMEGRRYSDGLHQALEAKEDVEMGEMRSSMISSISQAKEDQYSSVLPL